MAMKGISGKALVKEEDEEGAASAAVKEGDNAIESCQFVCKVDPEKIDEIFNGLMEAKNSEIRDRGQYARQFRVLCDQLEILVDGIWNLAQKCQLEGKSDCAQKLVKAYRKLTSSSHARDRADCTKDKLKELKNIMSEMGEVNVLRGDPYKSNLALKRMRDRDYMKYKEELKKNSQKFENVAAALKRDLLHAEVIQVGMPSYRQRQIVKYLWELATYEQAWRSDEIEGNHMANELIEVFEQLRSCLDKIASNARNALSPLKARNDAASFLEEFATSLTHNAREKVREFGEGLLKEIKDVNKTVNQVLDGYKQDWNKLVEPFDLIKPSANIKPVTEFVKKLISQKSFFENQSASEGSTIPLISASAAVKLINDQTERAYEQIAGNSGIWEIIMTGKKDVNTALEELNILLSNVCELAKLQEDLHDSIAVTVRDKIFNFLDSKLQQWNDALIKEYTDAMHTRGVDEANFQMAIKKINKHMENIQRLRSKLKPYADNIKAVKSDALPDRIISKQRELHNEFIQRNPGPPCSNDVVDHLVKIYQLSAFVSCESVKACSKEIISKYLSGETVNYALDINELAWALEAHISPLAMEIIGEFEIFENHYRKLWKQNTVAMASDEAVNRIVKKNKLNENHRLSLQEAISKYDNRLEERLAKRPKISELCDRLNSNFEKFKRKPVREKVPLIIADICALVALQKSREGADSSGRDVGRDSLLLPHAVQVLALFRLLRLDCPATWFQQFVSKKTGISLTKLELKNHLIQIGTGEGKSIVLGILAIFLARFGYCVDCVCYSKYLSERDYAFFEKIFKNLDVAHKISYSTFAQLASRNINESGDVREGTRRLLDGSLKSGDIVAEKQHPRILLIDEVDVFFSEQFYGVSYRPSASIQSKEVRELLEYVWNQKGPSLNLSSVQESSAYTALAAKYWDSGSSDSTLKEIFDAEINKMIEATTTYNNGSHLHEVEHGRVGIVEHGSVNTELRDGYNSTWWHFKYLENGRIEQAEFDRAAALGLSVTCGNFSYAEVPKAYEHILGVTGTLSTLGDFEKQIIEDEYNINTSTIMPSIYGSRDRNFFELCQVEPDVDAYHQKIWKHIKHAHDVGRATLVFFETELRLWEFVQSNYCVQELVTIVVSGDVNNINHYVKLATHSGQITLMLRVFGRGLDFVCLDKTVMSNKGVLVIQTFLSGDKAEEVQHQGRTCRQGALGSYMMILLENDLLDWKHTQKPLLSKDKWQNVEQSAASNTNSEGGGESKSDSSNSLRTKSLYDYLDEARNRWFNEKSQKRSETVKQAKTQHDESVKFQQSLVDGSPAAKIECLRFLKATMSTKMPLTASLKRHILFCLDKSYSMKGQGWEDLKRAVLEFISMCNKAGADYVVSFVLFNHGAEIMKELTHIETAASIDLGAPTGLTNFAPALGLAGDVFERGLQSHSDHLPILVFMSDGEPQDYENIPVAIERIRQRVPNLMSYFIYFGAESIGEGMLKDISNQMGGEFRHSANGIDLQESFVDIASQLTYTS